MNKTPLHRRKTVDIDLKLLKIGNYVLYGGLVPSIPGAVWRVTELDPYYLENVVTLREFTFAADFILAKFRLIPTTMTDRIKIVI